VDAILGRYFLFSQSFLLVYYSFKGEIELVHVCMHACSPVIANSTTESVNRFLLNLF
jgi:hypothetical protein